MENNHFITTKYIEVKRPIGRQLSFFEDIEGDYIYRKTYIYPKPIKKDPNRSKRFNGVIDGPSYRRNNKLYED